MGAFEHEQVFQGNLGTKYILKSNLEFILGEQSKKILGIRVILEIFLRNTGHWGPHTTHNHNDCKRKTIN